MFTILLLFTFLINFSYLDENPIPYFKELHDHEVEAWQFNKQGERFYYSFKQSLEGMCQVFWVSRTSYWNYFDAYVYVSNSPMVSETYYSMYGYTYSNSDYNEGTVRLTSPVNYENGTEWYVLVLSYCHSLFPCSKTTFTIEIDNNAHYCAFFNLLDTFYVSIIVFAVICFVCFCCGGVIACLNTFFCKSTTSSSGYVTLN